MIRNNKRCQVEMPCDKFTYLWQFMQRLELCSGQLDAMSVIDYGQNYLLPRYKLKNGFY